MALPDRAVNMVRVEESDGGRQPDATLVQAIARAHRWLKCLENGNFISIEDLAISESIHPKHIRSAIRLAFLSPAVTKTVLDGTQPPDWDLSRLTEMAAKIGWNEQSHTSPTA